MKIEFLGDHIHIVHEKGFLITAAGTKELWHQLSSICRMHRCSRVLVEADAPRRQVGTIDAFESGVEAAAVYPDLMLAMCFTNYEPDETSDLFITAARNRGVKAKFFSDKATALRWLGVAK